MATWLITGANRGLGMEIARAALEAGDRVLATARNPAPIAAALDGFGERLATTRLDVTDAASIAAAVELARQRFGGIDVLVNNAGYGQLGPFELISPAAIERQFATNVFGAFEVTRAVLPVMRAQRSGHVVTLSSIAGLIGIEGVSIYCATKFALEGWSESLGQEVARFGIRTTLIEPGRFRTDFLDASSVSHGDLAIGDYDAFAAENRAELDAGNHQQAGDPVKLGRAVVTLVRAPEPPVRYGAGSEAYGVMVARAERLRAEAEAWRELSLSNDLDA
ncbi:SDR family NAD(P)-dependent oxidoreductase [Burkholderia perseverans]|uniref:SDR family NAD(P)-dependent oxidoreductase n=1 Tax=Burkholderia perseverans TaxID=2615214 RepID=UPI001FED30F0|nr:SDR family NAD(P)-dependent oxidoreductase [Burkholderia perseverans]